MAQNITLLGASYSDVPAVELPKTGGGTATFYDADFKTVTQTLTNITSSADETRVENGNSFFAELTPTSGYAITSITVTMGGVDVTEQVFKPSTGVKAITENGTYDAEDDNLSGYSSVVVNVPTGSASLDVKSISTNGTYNASSDNLDGYSQVTVNVPNTYVSGDEGKVVSNGALVSQTSDTVTTNGTVDTTLISSLLVNVPTGGGTQAKTKSGTFTGNGSRQVSISCDFEPDLVFWRTDTGSDAFSGTRHGIIARGLMAINRYSNNSTNITNAISAPYITGMNTNGSGYAMRATYADSAVTIYCFTNAARSYFKNGQTYDYYFAKYTP